MNSSLVQCLLPTPALEQAVTTAVIVCGILCHIFVVTALPNLKLG